MMMLKVETAKEWAEWKIHKVAKWTLQNMCQKRIVL